ncbi:MAG: hypothetical protein LQ351_003560 [Letrouitia transgressa]|nr:MAG: hypothetical protein LQ351_003560 [Letrouitia transgressa]
MQRRMLSKEDEAAVGKGDLEVRREDQDKINKFSRLHQREMLLEEELREKEVSLQSEWRMRQILTDSLEGERGSGRSIQRADSIG